MRPMAQLGDIGIGGTVISTSEPMRSSRQVQDWLQESELPYSLDENRMIYAIHVHLDRRSGSIDQNSGRVRMVTGKII